MKPLPLRIRILAALQLAPMSARELRRVLSANPLRIRHWLDYFLRTASIERCGVEPGRTRPWNLYRIVR